MAKMTKSSFLRACLECKEGAKERGVRLLVLRDDEGELIISPKYSNGWLYQAYPGGRTILSLVGKDVLDNCQYG